MAPEAVERVSIEIEGRTLSLSNLDKVLYPSGFTKGQVIDYYVRIAPVLLPYLNGRNTTMRRFPNGSTATSFFNKNLPAHTPEWVKRVQIKDVSYPVVDDVATLVYVANLASLELHVPPHRAADGSFVPDRLVFDLDPGPNTGIRECAVLALEIRELLTPLGLASVAKTSGSKGIQVYASCPPGMEFEGPAGATAFTKALAEGLEARHPERYVTKQAKELRPGKVLIDWSQCIQAKTTVVVYSLRARDTPTVSTPVLWDEVADAAEGGPLSFTAPEVLERVAAHGDLFALPATP
jgi:bifunctional non-homologous end joining protein LigD